MWTTSCHLDLSGLGGSGEGQGAGRPGKGGGGAGAGAGLQVGGGEGEGRALGVLFRMSMKRGRIGRGKKGTRRTALGGLGPRRLWRRGGGRE